ncbi:hypothetical protein Tco_1241355 [Tanacetum coccineum]
MFWFSRCSWCGGPFNGGNCRRCTNVSFRDEFVCNPDPISNDETPDFSYPPPKPQTSLLDQFHCFHCKDSLENGVRCQRYTCKWCGYALREGSCWICPSKDGNSSIDAPNSFNDLPNVFTHPPQPQYESYLCELCGNDSHYGYDCPPRFPFYSIDHQEVLNQQRISDVHIRWDKIEESLLNMMQSFCEVVIQQKQAANIDQSPPQEMSIQEIEDLKQQYLDEMLSLSNQIQIKDYENEKIDIRYRRECDFMIDELKGKFNGMSIESNKKKELQQLKQAANLTRGLSHHWDENLSTIPEKESDEFIKSSVEDLVPIPSEFEDTSESDSECDLPSCNDFSPINVFKEKSVTFSNLLFDSNDDFTSSDDESLSDEDVSEDNSKDSYVSNLDEPALLGTPLFDANEDECFDPGGDVDEIEFLLHRDPSTTKISVASILEGFTDEPPLEENDDLFDLESKENEWKKILYDAPIDDLMTEDKVFDLGIHEKKISPTSHMLSEFFFLISPIWWILLFLSPPGVRISFLTPTSPL